MTVNISALGLLDLRALDGFWKRLGNWRQAGIWWQNTHGTQKTEKSSVQVCAKLEEALKSSAAILKQTGGE